MDPIGTVGGLINQVLDTLRHSPGGFGLLILPIGLLWIIVLLAARRR
jgi:hypothetical protein